MKVNETRKRSLLKSTSFRVVEITIDSLILSFFITPAIAIGIAIAIEGICWGAQYVSERVWNKINYGREIV